MRQKTTYDCKFSFFFYNKLTVFNPNVLKHDSRGLSIGTVYRFVNDSSYTEKINSHPHLLPTIRLEQWPTGCRKCDCFSFFFCIMHRKGIFFAGVSSNRTLIRFKPFDGPAGTTASKSLIIHCAYTQHAREPQQRSRPEVDIIIFMGTYHFVGLFPCLLFERGCGFREEGDASRLRTSAHKIIIKAVDL